MPPGGSRLHDRGPQEKRNHLFTPVGSWRQHLSNGQIANVVGKQCIGADGDVVVLMACDGGSTWETQGNGVFPFPALVFMPSCRNCAADVQVN